MAKVSSVRLVQPVQDALEIPGGLKEAFLRFLQAQADQTPDQTPPPGDPSGAAIKAVVDKALKELGQFGPTSTGKARYAHGYASDNGLRAQVTVFFNPQKRKS